MISALLVASGAAAPSAPTSPPREAHVDNPYRAAVGYVNPEWRNLAASVPGGDRVADNPTAVWIDSLALARGELNVKRGLRSHLSAALQQGAGYIQFVLHDLPGRDCDRTHGAGDFAVTEIERYQHEFIDVIAEIESDPRYGQLRIINIIEPDAVKNYVAAVSYREPAECVDAQINRNFVRGIQYALQQLHRAGSNVYTYVDVASHLVIGWDDLRSLVLSLLTETVKGTADGFSSLDGFATNTAGYSPLVEPHFKITDVIVGKPVRESRWVDWNDYLDEVSFAQDVRGRLIRAGFSTDLGAVIDTSRNGWGGPNRPTKTSASTDVEKYVDESRVDRRITPYNWCNQVGAGLGERPVVRSTTGIDAYAWVKPPGESDGASRPDPNGIDVGYSVECDPDFRFSGRRPVGAMRDAPAKGGWFPAALGQLMSNAYPSLT